MSQTALGRHSSFALVIEKARELAERWALRAAVFVVVVLFILEYLHVIENVQLGLGLIAALFYLLSEEIKRSNSELKYTLDRNLTAVQSITQSAMPRLCTLQECIAEVELRLHELKRGEHISVKHIGLDMVNAWEHVEKLLSSETLCLDVDYKLLILTDDSSKLGHVDPVVDAWCRGVKSISLPKIRKEAPEITPVFRQTGRKLNFSCKEYVYTPFVHGFEIRGSVNLCYVALCRWGGPNKDRLDWGQTNYIRIVDSTADPVQADLRRLFRSYFERHWNANPQVAISEVT